jgi:hypothetical protein
MAEFETAEQLLAATRRAHAEGYRRMDAYSPFPVTGLADALGQGGRTIIPTLVLLAGLLGGAAGFLFADYVSAYAYPLNVGSRPLHSWPAFIPVAFETTILGAALAAVFSMLILNRLPEPYHPVFNVARFAEFASRDRFFLCLEAVDPKFSLETARRFLESTGPAHVAEVPR